MCAINGWKVWKKGVTHKRVTYKEIEENRLYSSLLMYEKRTFFICSAESIDWRGSSCQIMEKWSSKKSVIYCYLAVAFNKIQN